MHYSYKFSNKYFNNFKFNKLYKSTNILNINSTKDYPAIINQDN